MSNDKLPDQTTPYEHDWEEGRVETDREREARIRRDVSGMLEWADDVADDTVFLLRLLDEARNAYLLNYDESHHAER